MAETRHLRNAPIREAIIDLRVKARSGLSQDDLSSALPTLKEAFPSVERPRLVLDIDAYRVSDIDPSSPDLERILRELRDLKNRLFFGSLTDQALRQFE